MDLQPYVEQLYGNESHTNALTDAGARSLLEWGERRLKVAAAKQPTEADLDQIARQLSRVLRAVNRMIELKNELPDDQLVERLLTLVDQAMDLQTLCQSGASQRE